MALSNTFSQLEHGRLLHVLPLARQGAPADVAQPPADRLARVEVDDEQRLLEARRPRQHLALVVEHDRVAVEEELVLAADEVAEREVGGVVARARDEHLLAFLRLADVVRRRGEIDEQLGAGEGEVGRRRARLPDVLADRRPDQRAAEPQQQQLASGREVAVLVEDAVVRQVALAVEALHLAVGADGAGVEEIAVEPGRADERRQPGARLRDLAQRLLGCADEARAEQQVLGRVPGDGELGEEDELRACRARVGQTGENALAVAVQVADDSVDLGESKPHQEDSSGLRLSGENITIDRRYRGPTQSANGGYAAGRLAAFVDGPAEVTLRLPPPLDRPLAVAADDGRVLLLDGEAVVAEARGACAGARAAAGLARGGRGCGHPARPHGRGGVLRVLHLRRAAGRRSLHPRRAGGRDETSTRRPWVAREVSPEVVWAAIDCPGAWAVGGPGRGEIVLGRMNAEIRRLPEEGEQCVVVAWPLGEDGRKLHAGTALLSAGGEVLALARQTWIAPKRRLSGSEQH